jgi:hypothetical protein
MYQSFQHTDFIEETIERPLSTSEQPFDQINEPQVKNPGISESDGRYKKIRVKELLDGTILIRENFIRQWPYILFLTLLGIIYIGNRFHAEKMVRQINELKIEVSNLRAEQITTTSELMNISRPSEVNALVESKGLGLKESLEPPKKIKR